MAAERFGPYRLDELVGRGGMGEVYRAYDTAKDRTVALKRLPRHLADDRGFKSQFRRESQIVARLREPHIIPIHDFGEIDGQLFIDMRLVEGVDLTSLLRQHGPLGATRAAAIALQVASALAAAHAEHLVHRDVKPANVLVIASDLGEDYVYLVDFGIAHDTTATEFGPGGAMVGSSEYMAPEQFVDGHADSRADIYSLGGLLYTALTGRTPFTAEGPAAQMYAHLHSTPPAPSAHEPDLPASFDQVVAMAMAKNPDDRYQSAAEFAAAVRTVLSDAATAAATAVIRAKDTAAPRSFGTGAIRALGWNANPALTDMARRVADQAAAVAGSLGIPTIGPWAEDRAAAGQGDTPKWRPRSSTDGLGRDPLGIRLFVNETISERTLNSVSEMFWDKFKSTMATLRNDDPQEEPSQPDDTVVLTTVFEEGANRTVIEVRIPARTAQESELDLDRVLSDAYAAANAQAMGDLRGKHVTVSPDASTPGSAVVTVTDAPPEV